MRADIIAIAEEATRRRRIVPFSICEACRCVADFMHKRETGHEPTVLTREEQDEVARIHKAHERAQLDEAKRRYGRGF